MNDQRVRLRGVWLGIAVMLCTVLFMGILLALSDAWGQAVFKSELIFFFWTYWIGFLLCWIALCFLLRHANKQGNQPSDLFAVLMIILFAFAFRFHLVDMTQPVLSDDIWRYIHDGGMLGQGTNPYLVAPDELPADQFPVPQIVDRMNNPGLVTIYQPTSQYVFAGLDRLWAMSPASFQRWDPDHDRLFRYGFVLFDMALIGLILWQLRVMGRSAWWAVAYAWHPLTISEVAGSGHQDVIGIAFLLLALVLAGRLVKLEAGEALSRKRLLIAVLAGVAFGLAVGVKPLVLPIALALAWVLRRRPGVVVVSAGATVLTGITLYLPFMLMDGGMTGMIETMRTFVDKWAFNGSAYDLVTRYVVGKSWVDYLAIAVLLAVIVATLCKKVMGQRPDAIRTAGAFLFASLLVSSTVHPWYLLWALALLPMYFSPALWVFSLTVAASYAAHLYPGYRVPTWVVIMEYLPVYGVLGWGCLRALRRLRPV